MLTFISILVLTLSYLDFASAGFTQCYYPDGSIPTDYIWEPCTGSKFSSCCVPSEGDICQADGLCYFPDDQLVYRGTCTDQTWQDPSCNVGTCVSGFETTWQWVGECVSSGSTSTMCGSMSDGAHATPTCSSNAVLNTIYVSTTSTTSAHIYTPPPSIDTARFSVETDTYTTTITAKAQTTTLTSTFESTKTNTLHPSQTGTKTDDASLATSTSSTGTSDPPKKKKSGSISIGVLIAIILGVLLLILLSLAAFFFIRHKKRTSQSIKLDNTEQVHPPPNGPVGADQVYPYEAPVNEVTSQKKYVYQSPKIDAYEMDDRAAVLREKRREGEGMGELDGNGGLRSPAPAYREAIMPVELDGTSSVRGASRG